MRRPRTMIAAVLVPALLLPLAATGEPPAPGQRHDASAPVIVIRGTQTQGAAGPEASAGQRSNMTPAARTEQGVIVMRPAPGSFGRETTRLADEAEAREERAMRQDARARDRQLTEAMQAVEDAARAVQQEARTRAERYYPIFVPARTEDPQPQ